MSKGYIDVENAFEYVLKVAEKKKISKRKLCEGIYEYSSFIKFLLFCFLNS